LRVLLGVTGGIAAYKSAEIVRRLRDAGHDVRCALTRNGAKFLPALVLETLSGRPVDQEEYLDGRGRGEEEHIAAAAWAEVLVVAPATTHTLARLALGLGDDFLSTTALAFDGPVVVAPAMHPKMWLQASTRLHVETLRQRGVRFVGPVEGPLASGEVGWGRMAEPAAVVAEVDGLGAARTLAGRRVVVTAGPTHEAIDPVRFIGNRSSGRMGFALAREAARRGAEVTLIAGPVRLETPHGVARRDVTTALQMRDALAAVAPAAHLVVMAAAVADFRLRSISPTKIKRGEIAAPGGGLTLDLEPNPDLLAELAITAPHAVRVGFAAETHELQTNALKKLAAKDCDFLVANDVSRADIGFDALDNEVVVYDRTGVARPLSHRPKTQLAADLLDLFEPALRRSEAS
jgi:phosphopantothenoylcysteine decarboxylase/phosphopantothenate--cysteine ligase